MVSFQAGAGHSGGPTRPEFVGAPNYSVSVLCQPFHKDRVKFRGHRTSPRAAAQIHTLVAIAMKDCMDT